MRHRQSAKRLLTESLFLHQGQFNFFFWFLFTLHGQKFSFMHNLFTFMRVLFPSQKCLTIELRNYQKMEMVQYLHNFFKKPCWTSISICSLYNTNIQIFSNLDKKNNDIASKVKTPINKINKYIKAMEILQKQVNTLQKQSSKGWQSYPQLQQCFGLYNKWLNEKLWNKWLNKWLKEKSNFRFLNQFPKV